MKQILSIITVLSLLCLAVGCGGGKYGDVVSLNEEFVKLMEAYLTSLDQAGSAKDVASAMNRFAESMEVLGPKMKKMAEKYPELKDKNNLPEVLKPSQQKAEEMGKKMAGSFMKAIQFMRSPEVQAAQKRLAGAMGTMT